MCECNLEISLTVRVRCWDNLLRRTKHDFCSTGGSNAVSKFVQRVQEKPRERLLSMSPRHLAKPGSPGSEDSLAGGELASGVKLECEEHQCEHECSGILPRPRASPLGPAIYAVHIDSEGQRSISLHSKHRLLQKTTLVQSVQFHRLCLNCRPRMQF